MKKKHTLPDGVRIPNIEALNDAMADGNDGYAIVLNGGLFARKTITWESNRYRVEDHVDGSVVWLTADQLFDERYSNIGKAMKVGAFVTMGEDFSPFAEIVGVIPAN